jgi:hypothetical protein
MALPHLPAQSAGSAAWQALGPAAVESLSYGSSPVLVSGRITALALDPSDATGNTLYVGATGGGVWLSQNAATSNAANVTFTPLTDNLSALSGQFDASITIGALSVQPGGTGVILAGTGDPNDALDSYYGGGILRSADGGKTWSLISTTVPTTNPVYSFAGEAIAGFAWGASNANTQPCGPNPVGANVVVAAVSQAYKATLVNALWWGTSYEGLYYSTDAGLNWCMSTITDGAGNVVQKPGMSNLYTPGMDGNAATAVVWNPVRLFFVAAVRYHGYYQSSDGVTWTRMTDQPGAGLMASAQLCPALTGGTGSTGCPIFRGALAVNPQTGDTFAWTVDRFNQDTGIWQDECAASKNTCANATIWAPAQTQLWSTGALETGTSLGLATIAGGNYTLALAAVPAGIGQQYGTILLAGADDLWKTACPYSQGCTWRNTTNSTVGFCAQVGEYQHSLAWNPANPEEIYVGNDSGLWRSLDAIGETGSVCGAGNNSANTDASHFQNLNGSLGSLAEVDSLSQVGITPYTMLAGLGVNGSAGVKSNSGITTDWPQILGGGGGPVAIDPLNSNNWYVNNEIGVSIYLCSQQAPCTPVAFGSSPVVTQADVGGDGLTMSAPAPFLVDPVDNSQLLIGTCRVWRGPASGVGWSAATVSLFIDGVKGNSSCSGDALIRSMAAQVLPASSALPTGGEIVYVGMYGSKSGGATLPGHVLSAIYNRSANTWSAWTDLTTLPKHTVTNDPDPLNYYGLDISSIFIDPHDSSGQTVYVTVAGAATPGERVQVVYGSTTGGTSWTDLTSNLPPAPVNSMVVDPQDAGTVYVATDVGVWSTREIASGGCNVETPGCWSLFGSELPASPVVALSAAPISAAMHDLVAATYGRGIWATPLWTVSEDVTTATASPASLAFSPQAGGTSSNPQAVTVTNTGTAYLAPTFNTTSGDFTMSGSMAGGCQSNSVAPGASCSINVSFAPTQAGTRTGTLSIGGNLITPNLTVSLSGTGTASGVVSFTQSTLSFSTAIAVGSTSAPEPATVNNSGSLAIPFTYAVSGPFSAVNQCAGSVIPANGLCPLSVTFTPTQAGAASGSITLTDAAPNSPQTLTLSGTGTGAVSFTQSTLSFSTAIEVGSTSVAQPVTINNSSSTAIPFTFTVSGPFTVVNQCTGSLIPAYGSCPLSVSFKPTQSGAASGSIILTATGNLPQTVMLSGTGLAPPTDTLSPTSLSFPSTAKGQLSTEQFITITNSGGVNLNSISATITQGASFVLGAAAGQTNPCSNSTELVPNSSCTIGIQFDPAATGTQTGTLTISDALRTQTVALSGSGLTPPALGVSSTSLSFATQAVGQSSLPQTVTITNTGQASMAGVDFAITQASGSGFSCSPNACSALTCAALASGASCSVQVVFTPTSAGGAGAQLVLTSPTAGVAPVSVQLTGNGLAASGLNASPPQLLFPIVLPGQTSQTKTVTVSYTGTGSASGLVLTATPPFSLVQNTCAIAPATLASGASCTTGVQFSPSLNGPYAGTLTITSASVSNTVSLPLSGTGGTPGTIQPQPSAVAFQQTGVGLYSSATTVTFANPLGNPDLTNFALGVTPGFRLVNNICPTTLFAGSSCTSGVEFAPASPGPQSGSLTVTSNGLTNGAFVSLSGMGFDFSITPSGSSTQAIVSGQTANYKLSITPLLGSQGAFTFQCGTLPLYSTCTFNPTSEGIPAKTSGSVAVQIATGISPSTARASQPPAWPVLPLTCAAALVPWALRRRRKALILIALLVALTCGVSSCTGSGGRLPYTVPTNHVGVTPAENYTITITAISNGVAHSVNLTLTVD